MGRGNCHRRVFDYRIDEQSGRGRSAQAASLGVAVDRNQVSTFARIVSVLASGGTSMRGPTQISDRAGKGGIFHQARPLANTGRLQLMRIN